MSQKGDAIGPLSSRLRPNVECAPWVIEEVKLLELHAQALELLVAGGFVTSAKMELAIAIAKHASALSPPGCASPGQVKR